MLVLVSVPRTSVVIASVTSVTFITSVTSVLTSILTSTEFMVMVASSVTEEIDRADVGDSNATDILTAVWVSGIEVLW